MPQPARQARRTLATLALLAATPALAAAQTVLFDNGVPDELNGYVVSGPFATPNVFTLSAASSLDGFAWYAIGPVSGSPATVSGGFTWRIFADAAGSLGSQLYGGTVSGAIGTVTPYGCCGDRSVIDADTYLFEAALGGIALGPGRHWLELSAATIEGADFVAWARSSTADSETAFRITGVADVTAVPEPASLALLGTGLVGLGAFARRRARRSPAD